MPYPRSVALNKICTTPQVELVSALSHDTSKHASIADKLVVIVGDLNHNFCVHSPANERGSDETGPPVIHFSDSPGLPSISEVSAVSSSVSAALPDGQMVGFIKALLTRAKDSVALFEISGKHIYLGMGFCFISLIWDRVSSMPLIFTFIFNCLDRRIDTGSQMVNDIGGSSTGTCIVILNKL